MPYQPNSSHNPDQQKAKKNLRHENQTNLVWMLTANTNLDLVDTNGVVIRYPFRQEPPEILRANACRHLKGGNQSKRRLLTNQRCLLANRGSLLTNQRCLSLRGGGGQINGVC